MKLFEKIKFNKEHEIRFLGIPIIQYGRTKENKDKKYFKIFNRSLRRTFIQEIKSMNVDFDDLYIIRQRTGETFIFAQAIKKIIELNDSKKPLVVGIREFQEEIFRLVEKDINYLYVPSEYNLIGKFFPKTKNKVGKHNVYNCMRLDFYKDFYQDTKKGNGTNYIEHILEEFNLDKNLIDEFKSPCYEAETRESALQKAKNMNLNLDKFVFILPQAYSMKPLSNNFWNTLHCRLNDLGYDVFYNLSPETKFYGGLKQSSEMSIEESLYIASISKNIIGLRSGFIEPLVFSDVPMNIIYTETVVPIINNEEFKKYFTLESYRRKAKINEYVLNNEEKLLNSILANIKEINCYENI